MGGKAPTTGTYLEELFHFSEHLVLVFLQVLGRLLPEALTRLQLVLDSYLQAIMQQA